MIIISDNIECQNAISVEPVCLINNISTTPPVDLRLDGLKHFVNVCAQAHCKKVVWNHFDNERDIKK